MRQNTLHASNGWGHPMISEKIKFLSLAVFMLLYSTSFTQESFTLSNLSRVPQGSNINPAQVPTHLKHYIGIPLLSNIRIGGNGQGFTFDNLGVNKLTDWSVNYDQARREVSDMNTYRVDSQVDLLYAGIATKSGFFTFNFTERVVGDSWVPRDFFRRYADEEQGDLIAGRWYDLQNLMAQAMHFKELGLGYTTQNRKGINWGVRLKFLLGHEAMYSVNDEWVVREDGEGGLFTEGSLAVRSAGFRHYAEGESLFRLFSAKNAGVALDAGLSYEYNDQWSFFASVRDLGGITWRRGLNNRMMPATFSSLMDEVDGTFDDLVYTPAETTTSFRTKLSPRVMGGARYEFKNKHAINGLATARFYDTETELGVSLGYGLPITSWLEGTVNYSIYNKTYNNVGAGLALEFGNVQLYFASDNIVSVFGPTSATNYHFQTGLNLVWKKPEEDKKKPMANLETIQPDDEILHQGQTDADRTQDGDIAYFTLRSEFTSEVPDQEIEAIYVDIYRYKDNDQNQKQLIHTSRYPSDEFEVTLYRISNMHELTVRAYGYEPVVYQFTPESEGVFRQFKFKPQASTSGK